MKKIIFPLLALSLIQPALAQETSPVFINNPYPKTITVSGSAEMEVTPDEIYVLVELKEYQKKGESKKDLETIKTQFLAACKAAGIADSLVSIASYSGYGDYYQRKKKKNTDLFAGITYQVKFKNSKMMDDLVEKLDDEATRQFLISNTSHSQVIEFRRQLKIKAVQAAKEKGIYLTEAIGEELGEAITIHEPSEWQPVSYRNSMLSNNAYSNIQAAGDNSPEIDFKKLKLRFEVTVVFALK